MARRWIAIAWMGLTGCNQIFQLDETEEYVDPCPMDGDCDGVIDAVDNCAELANPTQGDADGDARGDACDPCGMQFSAMDYDQDGVLPADDVCPGAADAAQTDADGDGVGDACDPSDAVAHTRTCFTDFRVQEDVIAAWPLGGPWKWLSQLMHTPADTMPFAIVERGTRLPSAGTVQVVLQPSASDLDFATGVAIAARDGALLARCELFRTAGGALSFRLADARGVLATAPFELLANPQALTLTYAPAPAGTALRCAARSTGGGPTALTATTDAALAPVSVALTSTTTITVFEALAIYAP